MRKLLLCFFFLTGVYLVYSTYSNDSIDSTKGSPESSDDPSVVAERMARVFVEQNIGSCDWQPDIVKNDTFVPNRFKLYQKFYSSYCGYRSEYVFRMYIQYFGGDINNVKNWDYGQLIIENVATGKQDFYHGKMKARESITSGSYSVGDLVLDVVVQKPNVLRLSYKRELTDVEIKTFVDEYSDQFENLYLCVKVNGKISDDYIYVLDGKIFDFRNE